MLLRPKTCDRSIHHNKHKLIMTKNCVLIGKGILVLVCGGIVHHDSGLKVYWIEFIYQCRTSCDTLHLIPRSMQKTSTSARVLVLVLIFGPLPAY